MYFSFFKLKKWGKKTAETRRRNCAVVPKIIFCRGAPQGGLSCPFGAIHLLYLTENTTQAASVRFVRQRRTNRARGRLQSFCQKRAKPFFDSLEYCMYFSFFKLKKWGKKAAETRRRNCAVLP